jgi:putative NADH-flavin reductase
MRPVTVLYIYLLYAIGISVALALRGVRPGIPAARTSSTSGTSISRVLIVGATGGTGRQLVAQALERGYVVTALARDPSKLRLDHPRLRVLQGDVLDYASVETAVKGQDAVLSALGHKRFFYPTRILSEGTRNLLRAMEAHKVPRLVCQTSLGIGDSAGRMGLYYTFLIVPIVLPFYYWDKTRQERWIAASEVEWVIVRPGKLTNGEARRSYRHGPKVGNFVWTVRISRADVADFMLNQATDDTYLRAAPGVSS